MPSRYTPPATDDPEVQALGEVMPPGLLLAVLDASLQRSINRLPGIPPKEITRLAPRLTELREELLVTQFEMADQLAALRKTYENEFVPQLDETTKVLIEALGKFRDDQA